MRKNNIPGSGSLRGFFLIVVHAFLFIPGCGGSSGGTSTSVTLPPQPVIGTIADVDAAAKTEPYLSGNSVQYYCDCQAGAAAGCAAGSDTTGDGSQATPYQTLDAAMAWVDGAAYRTAALCRGGAFTTANTGKFIYMFNSHNCPAGNICNEVREYPVGGSVAKPLITNPVGAHYLFSTRNDTGGWRFMNLKLQGSWDIATGSNWAFFLYANLGLSPQVVHDIIIKNVDMDSFDLAVDVATNENSNITITGNHINNSSTFATLGACSNLTISYNSFINNGGDNMFDHTIYVGSHSPVRDVSIVGNYIYGFSTASGNTTCLGGPLVGHGEFTNLTVSGNIVQEDTTAGAGCWGISFNAGGYAWPTFFRNAIITDNIVINGGNTPLSVSNSPGVLVANNLIIKQSASNGGKGIAVAGYLARTPGTGGLGYAEFTGAINGTTLTVSAVTTGAIRTGMTLFGSGITPNTTIVSGSGNSWVVSAPQTVSAGTAIIGESCVPGSPSECSDTAETGASVVNNTIYSDTTATNGIRGGVYIGAEGSGYTVANNTVVYTGTSFGLQSVECFSYDLPPDASHFSFMNNNNCYSNASIGNWVGLSSTLTDWQQTTGFDMNSSYTSPGWTFATPLTLPTWDDTKTAAQLYAAYFTPTSSALVAAGDHIHAPTEDIAGTTRPVNPGIGAYEP